MKKVVKFGGSSLANAKQFKKVADIIKADKSRRYVVPSAPGKRNDKDEKVTDMLYACYDLVEKDEDFRVMLMKIKDRYDTIINGLNLKLSLEEEFKKISENFKNKAGVDYAASRGEYLNGIIMAAYLGYEFIDAAEVIVFDENGNFDGDKTHEILSARLENTERAVIPGFYGAMPDGSVHTFSRGGSDITGALAAAALDADVYENWTDVSGFLMADPKIVKDPKPIERITYAELRELSYIGAQVLHEGTVSPVREKNIPLNIRNTNQPEHPGTMIRETFEESETERTSGSMITGIAGKKGFSVITLTKNGMSSELGAVRRILEVLARKAAGGVDVRVMYDGTCEFSTLPRNYPRLLEKLNIQCKVFSPVQPFVSTHYNYRDHRKILVIDGRVGFTGGVNVADEYINHIQKHGRWKDPAEMMDGEAVRSLTAQFLQMWGILKEPEYEQFLTRPIPVPENAKGVAAPYGDCPLDGERVGEMVYIDLLNRARDYIHIMTPYLILDGELETALKFAAERGVDVHLILPGKPDKRFPYALAKSHYSALLDSGVKISEWSPGFVHAKVFVVDGREAVVGTINLDYRSLYHHFEDAVWMVDAPCIRDIEQDFQHTLEQSRTVENTSASIWQKHYLLRATGMLLKVIAPLL